MTAAGRTADEPAPLTGFTVAVTADRRSAELRTLLERRGARVVTAPAITIVPLRDDVALRLLDGTSRDTVLAMIGSAVGSVCL
ncbi:uroporphyrinogen-III synthase, partial [Micromonospora zhanjiangensis]